MDKKLIFECNKIGKKIYIQSVYTLVDESELKQEERSLLEIKDSFKNVIITHNSILPHYNEHGIYIVSLKDFLLNSNIICI